MGVAEFFDGAARKRLFNRKGRQKTDDPISVWRVATEETEKLVGGDPWVAHELYLIADTHSLAGNRILARTGAAHH